MGFIWFFFMIFTMGSASRFSEYIKNKTSELSPHALYINVKAF